MKDKVTITFPISNALLILFITLKLTKVIDWSWTWVLAPLWIPLILFFVVLGLVAIGALIVTILEK